MGKTMKNKWLMVLMLGIFGLAAAVGTLLFAWPSPASALDTTVTVTQKCKGHWDDGPNMAWVIDIDDGGGLSVIGLPGCSDTTVVTLVPVPHNAVQVLLSMSGQRGPNRSVFAHCEFANAYDGTKIKNECKAKGVVGTGKNKQKLEVKNVIKIN